MELPTGTVVILLADMKDVPGHLQLLDDVASDHRGVHVSIQEQGGAAVFALASSAVAAAVQLQRARHVRIAIHAGDAEIRDGRYVGGFVDRCAMLRAAAHPGQILLSRGTAAMAGPSLPPGAALRDLGPQRLADLLPAEHVFEVAHPDLPAGFPPLAGPDSVPNNLPAFHTSFLGREADVVKVAGLVAGGRRLVTLTGPGGIGKTRLACHAGAEATAHFDGGAWFVPLADLADPNQVAGAIARELHVAERSGCTVTDALAERLAIGRTLLLLDNFEHLADAAHLVEELLARCPSIAILVTSRALLRISGELEFAVSPLAVASEDHPPSSGHAASPAADLFVDRAREVRPGFVLNDENARFVAALCRLLDGIPLAVELAAARARILSPRDLFERISMRSDVLTAAGGGGPERHRTLQAAIAWSYELLEPVERRLWRWLSVFRGGFTISAAETVCDPVGIDVLEGVSSLAETSLLVVEEQSAAVGRFKMLEPLRRFANEKLVHGDEEVDARNAHLNWCVGLAERAKEELAGPDQARWLLGLESEHENLCEALDWCSLGADRGDTGARLAGMLGRFWWARGHYSRGRDLLARALAAVAEPGEDRALLLYWLGRVAFEQGDSGSAEDWTESALKTARDDSLTWLEGQCLVLLAYVRRDAGDLPGARSVAERALELARAGDGGRVEADALLCLASIEWRRRSTDEAESLLEESMRIYRAHGDKLPLASVLNRLAILLLNKGDHGGAELRWREALSLYRELANRPGIANVTGNLGQLAHYRGDFTEAAALYEQVLEEMRLLGNMRGVAITLVSLGAVAHRTGAYARARSLFEESMTVWQQLGHRDGVAEVLFQMAILAADTGRRDDARRLYEDVESRAREVGNDQMAAQICLAQGELLLIEGDTSGAIGRFDEALGAFEELGDGRSRALTLCALARAVFSKADLAGACNSQLAAFAALRGIEDKPTIAACLEQAGVFACSTSERGARLWGAADAVRQTTGSRPPPPFREWLARSVAGARQRFGETEISSSWDKGRSMTIEEAVAEAEVLLAESVPVSASCVFRKQAGGWEIAYEGSSCRLGDMKGLHYLASLLARPGRELHVLQLTGTTAQELPEAIADLGEGAEQIRLNVGKTIRRALSVVARHHPQLGRHLEATVRTGMFCSYAPDPRNAPAWEL